MRIWHRDAGKLWEDSYTQVLEGMGFKAGLSNPCIFHHADRDISLVVHGDDFTALGNDDQLTWYEEELQKSFEVKLRGRLGEGCPGPQEIRILNRIVTIDEHGLQYEADPRHCDLLASSLSLSSSSHAATPGVKPVDRDEHAAKSEDPEHFNLEDYSDPDRMIAAICRGDSDLPVDIGHFGDGKGSDREGRHSMGCGHIGEGSCRLSREVNNPPCPKAAPPLEVSTVSDCGLCPDRMRESSAQKIGWEPLCKNDRHRCWQIG